MSPAGSDPLVSVVLPTYDRPDLLADAVGCVFDQEYRPLELVVVDDHSPTPARQAVAGGAPDPPAGVTVRWRRHDRNRGASAARNTGIAAADGAYLAFLDDDDRWRPDKLARQVDRATADPDVGVVHTGMRYVDGDGRTTAVRPATAEGDLLPDLLCGASLNPFSTVLVAADLVDRAGDLDERFPSWQDWEWYVRLARHAAVAAVRDPLVVRRMTDHDQISDDYETKREVTYPLFLEKYRPLAAEYGPRHERRFVAAVSRTLASSALSAGRPREALWLSLRAIRHDPTCGSAYLHALLGAGGRPLVRSLRWLRRRWLRRRHESDG